ncbi:MAG: hypothetical protein ABSC92_09540 [Rhizomicrobium sp.]
MPESLSFDYCLERKKPWIAFEDTAQFSLLADRLAQQAARESQQLAAQITNIQALAVLLVAKEGASANEGGGGGWSALNAAVASGMCGDMDSGRKYFASAYASIGGWRPDLQILLNPYADAFKEKSTFANFIAQRIDEQRSMYGLGRLSSVAALNTEST